MKCKLSEKCKFGNLCKDATRHDSLTVLGCSSFKTEKPMTEQEYIQSCNHKELTEILFRMIVHGSVIRPDRQYISEWLKQPHKE